MGFFTKQTDKEIIMKTHRHSVIALAGGLCLVASAFIQPALAADPRPDAAAFQAVVGDWFGLFQLGAVPPGPCKLSITGGRNRLFTGMLLVGTDGRIATVGGIVVTDKNASDSVGTARTYAIDGNIVGSNYAEFSGRSSTGSVAGKVNLLDFGSGAAILNGTFTEQLAGRPLRSNEGEEHGGNFGGDRKQESNTTFLRSYLDNPSKAPPSVAGTWTGEAVSTSGRVRSTIDAHFVADASLRTGFLGTVNWGDVPPGPCRGTINGDGQVVLIAPQGDDLLVLTANFVKPPNAIKGNFRVTHKDGTVVEEGTFQIATGGTHGN
jgi:hypothetical protein